MIKQNIDWSIFDKYPQDTITCRCGSQYHGHAKAIYSNNEIKIISRIPCPGCGENNNISKVSSEPETMTIAGNK